MPETIGIGVIKDMTLSNILNSSLRSIKRNSPEILTGLGVAGVISTSYLVGRASFKAAIVINDKADFVTDEKLSFKEEFKLTWKLYVPPIISGTLTIASIIGSSKASGRRTAAAVTAYSVLDRAFSEYKEHIVEEIGKSKEQKIRDEIAQKRVTENPPDSREIVVIGRGQVLCCELFTGRYFKCDMETLRKAENDLNAMVVNSWYCTLSDFYDLLDLDHTSTSDKMGWDTDKLLQLEFSHALSPDGEPCLTFDYNYIRPSDRKIMS